MVMTARKSKILKKWSPLNRSPSAKALELAQFKPRLIVNKKKVKAREEARSVPDRDDW